MPATSVIRKRADELRQLPNVTPLRLYWMLRAEFGGAERDQLVNAAKLEGHRTGVTPNGGRLNPVVIRWQKRGRPEQPVGKRTRKVVKVDYPVITIEARNLLPHDAINGHGAIEKLAIYSTMVYVKFTNGDDRFYMPLDHVEVRLEDHGD